MIPRVRRALAWSVLFIGGYNAALPVAEGYISVPWVFTPIQVAHGVFLRDALFIFYIAVFGLTKSLSKISLRYDQRRFAMLVTVLGFTGILSAVVNVTSFLDIGEAMRLLLFAAYFAVAVDWAHTYGGTFLLRTYLLGIGVGGVINIYYTYQVQAMVLGILPFLLGQNGPGGFLGLSVVLSAWLILLHRSRGEILIAVGVAAIGLFSSSISYSRLSMLQAGCGLVAWAAVIFAVTKHRVTQRRGLALATLALLLVFGLAKTSVGGDYLDSVRKFAERKFNDVSVRDSHSVGTRYQYFWGVLDIFMENPLVGVGYSGFFDAVTATPTYKSGLMADEGSGAAAQRLANPHNAFLYYVAANGVFGLVLGPLLFVAVTQALFGSLRPYGLPGLVVWLSFVAAYFINAMTLPTLFNSEVIYITAAVAFSQQRRQTRQIVGTARPSWSTAPAY